MSAGRPNTPAPPPPSPTHHPANHLGAQPWPNLMHPPRTQAKSTHFLSSSRPAQLFGGMTVIDQPDPEPEPEPEPEPVPAAAPPGSAFSFMNSGAEREPEPEEEEKVGWPRHPRTSPWLGCIILWFRSRVNKRSFIHPCFVCLFFPPAVLRFSFFIFPIPAPLSSAALPPINVYI